MNLIQLLRTRQPKPQQPTIEELRTKIDNLELYCQGLETRDEVLLSRLRAYEQTVEELRAENERLLAQSNEGWKQRDEFADKEIEREASLRKAKTIAKMALGGTIITMASLLTLIFLKTN